MGHSTAEAVVRAGLTLVPFSFTGASEAVAVGNIGVSGIPVELVHPDERQQALDDIRALYPDLITVDYTLPSAVNGGWVGGWVGGGESVIYLLLLRPLLFLQSPAP